MDFRIGVCCWLSILLGLSCGYQDLSISQKVARLEALVSEIVKQNSLLKNELDEVKSETVIQKTEIQKLQAENSELKREVTYIKERFFGQYDGLNKMNVNNNGQAIPSDDSDSVSDEQIEVSTLNGTAVLKGKTRNRRLLAPATTIAASTPTPCGEVGFFAVMTDHNQQLGVHQTIKFQKMITNIGHGFDSNTGVFRAPVSGLYYFSAQLLTHFNEDFEAELVKNGATLVSCYVGNGDTFGSSGLTAVLHLAAGDDVWIQINKSSFNDGNVRVHGTGFSWFSGFLITTR